MAGLRALDVPNATATASADVGAVRGGSAAGRQAEPGVTAPRAAARANGGAGAGAGAWVGVAAGAGAMICVGGSVAVSSVLATAPVFTAEALRYAMACLILLLLARLTGRRLTMPRGTEWLWLCGIAATGLVLFNVALVAGSRHAEPAVLGVGVACVPSLLAVIGPLLEGSRPRPFLVAAAVVVTLGAALVQGTGRTDGAGVAWAVVVFGCEAAFTLLAIPVLGRHGPWGVSVHATWLATVIFAAIGLVHEGPAAAVRLGPQDWLAIVYLGVAVTAAAFVMWYSSVGRLGASRAGLLAGVAPVAAAATGVLLGGPAPRPQVWAGIAVVAAGLALGLRRSGKPGRDDVASRRLWPSRCDIVTVGPAGNPARTRRAGPSGRIGALPAFR
jgi:drug/metabolite transporter (DMT)-like permease